jgi:hypothetical protein
MPQKHSHPIAGGRAFWYTERLWQLAQALPVLSVRVDSVPEFDQNCWFTDPPSCRQVAEHARQIFEADLEFPIILSADGRLMDGGHRLARAWLMAIEEVKAVRFEVDPEPDYVVPDGDEVGG